MLFNSWTFVVFLLIVFSVYYLIPKAGLGERSQVLLLFISSLIFYAYKVPVLVFLLLFSIAINCLVSRAIVLSANRYGKGISWLWAAVTINLLILMFFKYAFLLADFLIPEGYLTGIKNDLLSIPLPVGISFYTFQAITLIVDLNRKGVVGIESLDNHFRSGKNSTGFLNIAFYIAFFPQLVAGPIVKAHDFLGQIKLKHFNDINWNTVTSSLITGFFLKMVIADNLKDVTNVLDTSAIQVLGKLDLIFLLYGYSFQIFSDFAGYSLIAIGLGAAFGYRFPINFNFPYISTSITEFWRRWHISLSSFLKEYLYYPLGGNRKGAYRTYINLFIVMFLGGLWHGAAWSYAIWGMSHGLLLAVEKAYNNHRVIKYGTSKSTIKRVFKIFLIFNVVSFLWLLFIMPDFNQVIQYFDTLISTDKLVVSPNSIFVVVIYSIPVILYHISAYFREHPITVFNTERVISRFNFDVISLSFMLFFISLNSGSPGAFIYFQF